MKHRPFYGLKGISEDQVDKAIGTMAAACSMPAEQAAACLRSDDYCYIAEGTAKATMDLLCALKEDVQGDLLAGKARVVDFQAYHRLQLTAGTNPVFEFYNNADTSNLAIANIIDKGVLKGVRALVVVAVQMAYGISSNTDPGNAVFGAMLTQAQVPGPTVENLSRLNIPPQVLNGTITLEQGSNSKYWDNQSMAVFRSFSYEQNKLGLVRLDNPFVINAKDQVKATIKTAGTIAAPSVGTPFLELSLIGAAIF